MADLETISPYIRSYPLKFDDDKDMDISYGDEYLATHNVTTHKNAATIVTDTRLQRLYNVIMKEAIQEESSDIQIADWGEYGLVRLRIGSKMVPYRVIHKHAVESLIVVFRDKAEINPEKIRTSDIEGTISYTYTKVNGEEQVFDTRLAFSPTIRGSMVAVRILYPTRLDMTIDELGLSDKVAHAYKQAIKSTEGLIVLTGSTGSGKGISIETQIPMYISEKNKCGFKNMGQLKVGDVILDADGNPTTVTAIYDQPLLPCYELTFSDGTKIIADETHNWLTSTRKSRVGNNNQNKSRNRKLIATKEDLDILQTLYESKNISEVITIPRMLKEVGGRYRGVAYSASRNLNIAINSKKTKHYNAQELILAFIERLCKPLNDQRHLVEPETVKTTKEIYTTLTSGNQGHRNHSIKLVSKAVDYPKQELPIHPYVFGVWLGDGSSYSNQITFIDYEILDTFNKLGYPTRTDDPKEHVIINTPENVPFVRKLKELGVLKFKKGPETKKIPDIYIYSDEQQRRDLLAGLLDSDGHAEKDKGGVSFTNTNKQIIDSFRIIAHSLGYQTTVTSRIGKYKNDLGIVISCKRAYTISFFPKDKVFELTRKRDDHKETSRKSQGHRQDNRYIVSCEPVPSVPTRCITVDSESHLFLCTEAYIPTHNTTTQMTGIKQILLNSEFTSNIMTIENPVEYRLEGITQSSVNTLHGYTFPVALQTILRQDPDVVLVGEINDIVTAQTAIRAATSGHLVFTTVHANNTLEVSNALRQLGVSDIDLGNALRIIIYQTLKDKLCTNCREQSFVNMEQKKWMDSKLLGQPEQATYFKAHEGGCDLCNHKGVKGRVMLTEMVESNFVYRIIKDKHGTNIDAMKRELLTTEGASFYPLEYDVYRHLQEGNISFEDAVSMVGK